MFLFLHIHPWGCMFLVNHLQCSGHSRVVLGAELLINSVVMKLSREDAPRVELTVCTKPTVCFRPTPHHHYHSGFCACGNRSLTNSTGRCQALWDFFFGGLSGHASSACLSLPPLIERLKPVELWTASQAGTPGHFWGSQDPVPLSFR